MFCKALRWIVDLAACYLVWLLYVESRKEKRKKVEAMKVIILLLVVLGVPAYIFISGGFSAFTVVAAVSWVLASLGVGAYIGGEKRSGIVAIALGIIISIIFLH